MISGWTDMQLKTARLKNSRAHIKDSSKWGCPQEAITISVEEVTPQEWERKVKRRKLSLRGIR